MIDMTTQTKKTSPVKTNFLVDIAIFVAFLIALEPRLTGMAIHEWLGIAFGAAIVTHLVLHWKWLVATTKRFIGRLPGSTRINYILNALFFINMTVLVFTGLMISETALPALGIQLGEGRAFERLHMLTADWALYLLALHVALHWRWILNTTNRYVVQPLLRPFRQQRREQPAVALSLPTLEEAQS